MAMPDSRRSDRLPLLHSVGSPRALPGAYEPSPSPSRHRFVAGLSARSHSHRVPAVSCPSGAARGSPSRTHRRCSGRPGEPRVSPCCPSRAAPSSRIVGGARRAGDCPSPTKRASGLSPPSTPSPGGAEGCRHQRLLVALASQPRARLHQVHSAPKAVVIDVPPGPLLSQRWAGPAVSRKERFDYSREGKHSPVA